MEVSWHSLVKQGFLCSWIESLFTHTHLIVSAALLRAGPGGNAAMLVAWERLPNGKFGPIQRDGGVRLGDILLRLNTVDLHQRRFEDVMTMLRNPGILNKRLTFVSKEKVRGVEGLWGGGGR